MRVYVFQNSKINRILTHEMDETGECREQQFNNEMKLQQELLEKYSKKKSLSNREVLNELNESFDRLVSNEYFIFLFKNNQVIYLINKQI